MTGTTGGSEGQGASEGPRPGPGPGPVRRRPPVVPLLALLAIIGGLALLVVARSSPEQQVRRLIDRQMKLAVADAGLRDDSFGERPHGIGPSTQDHGLDAMVVV